MSAADGVLVVEERPHNLVRPSSFERAETCPQSAVPVPVPRRSSVWADEGTVAHALFEAVLSGDGETYEFLDVPVYAASAEPDDDPLGVIDMEMISLVDPMVDAIRENLKPGFAVEPELRLPETPIYGYADVIGHSRGDGLLTVADLKFGSQFVPTDTPQVGLYLLMGLIAQHGAAVLKGPADAVVGRTVILQPRLSPEGRGKEWTRGEVVGLYDRARRLVDLLQTTPPAKLPFAPGAHCKWCPRAGRCDSLRLLVRDAALARIEPDPANPLSVDLLEEAAALLPAVKTWIGAVEAEIDRYLFAGGKMEMAKIILGRKSREWIDEAKAKGYMAARGVTPYMPAKMMSPAQAEKAVSKADLPGLKALIRTLPGKPRMALAHESGEPVELPVGLENAALAMLASQLIDKTEDET